MYRRPSQTTRRETRERIIRAATKLFAKRGFAATTTRDIARLAKVNDALIYYYFGRKQDLYWTVLEEARRDSQFMESLRETLHNETNGQVAVAKLFDCIVEHVNGDDTLLRLLLFTGIQEGGSFRGLSRRFFKVHLHTSYDLVASYVAKQIRNGKFRNVNPVIAAQAMFSLATYPYLIQEFFGGKYARRYSPKHMGQTLSEFWLQAMRTSGGK